MRLLHIFPVLLASCNMELCDNTDRWCNAAEIIWESYEPPGGHRLHMPRVEWKRSGLTCGTIGWMHDGICVAGLYYPGTHIVVSRPDGLTCDKSALAHELWHAALYTRGDDMEYYHTGPGWWPGGAVELANSKIRPLCEGW